MKMNNDEAVKMIGKLKAIADELYAMAVQLRVHFPSDNEQALPLSPDSKQDLTSAPNCRARWVEGVLSAPGPVKPSGFCTLLAGHVGDHIFPNNNRQPSGRLVKL